MGVCNEMTLRWISLVDKRWMLGLISWHSGRLLRFSLRCEKATGGMAEVLLQKVFPSGSMEMLRMFPRFNAQMDGFTKAKNYAQKLPSAAVAFSDVTERTSVWNCRSSAAVNTFHVLPDYLYKWFSQHVTQGTLLTEQCCRCCHHNFIVVQ